MKYNFLRTCLIAVILSSPLPALAAAVDGEPDINLQSDKGLYVWRANGIWSVRLVSGPYDFDGRLESSNSMTSLQPELLESSDRVRLVNATTLTMEMTSWPGGQDGFDFVTSNNGDLCLRNVGSQNVPLYLGANETRVSMPFDLLNSGACGSPSAGDTPEGLYISRNNNSWEVRLESDTNSQAFNGTLEATQSLGSLSRDQLEGSDSVVKTASDVVTASLSSWPGGYDAFSFSAPSGTGICVRDLGGTDSSVYFGATPADAVAVNLPADLTNSGACDDLQDPPPPPPPAGRKFNAGHYTALLRNYDSQNIMGSTMTAGTVGFKKRYTWRSLEPSQGVYDFSEIASDLNFLASQGMQLIVMIEDKTFGAENPLPTYLSGSAYVRRSRSGGYSAVRWNPTVISRQKALYTALGNRFDSNPAFEGVSTQESAPSLDNADLDATNYTPEKYRNALIETLTHANAAMPKSRVFWYFNFLPRKQAYIEEVLQAIRPLGVIAGGPDILPDDEALQQHTYPLYRQFKSQMPLFGQVEGICYEHLHESNAPTKYWTPRELYDYGTKNLGVDYIFWVRIPKSTYSNSYDYNDAVPVINSTAGSFNQ